MVLGRGRIAYMICHGNVIESLEELKLKELGLISI